MKQCLQCHEYKPLGEYYKVQATEDGRHRYCKQCCKVNRALESVRRRDKKSKISRRQLHRAQTLRIAYDVSIDLSQVFRKANGICARCKKWVQPRYASIDHITPLSRGGTHTWDNVQLMHFKCNLRKGIGE